MAKKQVSLQDLNAPDGRVYLCWKCGSALTYWNHGDDTVRVIETRCPSCRERVGDVWLAYGRGEAKRA